MSLTPTQSKLLAFIIDRMTSTGVTPSIREMREAVGANSISGVYRTLEALEADGKIVRSPGRARRITIVDDQEFQRGYRAGYAACRAELTAQRSAAA